MKIISLYTTILVVGCFCIIFVKVEWLISDKKLPRIAEDCSECGVRTEDVWSYLIAGGLPVSHSSIYPWMVSIRLKKEHRCGGAIINQFQILTAGHCVKGKDGNLINDMQVYFQTSSMRQMSDGFAIKEIIIHPGYAKALSNTTNTLYSKYDIALLKLEKKITCDKYKNSICLPDADFKLSPGDTSIVSGWGRTEPGKPKPSVLRHGKVKNLDFTKCVEDSPFAKEIQSHTLCEGGTGASTCFGDSGSPLVHKIKGKFYAIGIVSTGTPKSCDSTSSRIYTNVIKFLGWIKKNLKPGVLTHRFTSGRNPFKKQTSGIVRKAGIKRILLLEM